MNSDTLETGIELKEYYLNELDSSEIELPLDRNVLFNKINQVNLSEISKNLIAPSRNLFTNYPYIREITKDFSIVDFVMNVIDRKAFDNKNTLNVWIEDKIVLRDYLSIRIKQLWNINRTVDLNQADRVIYPSKFRDGIYKQGCNILLKLDLIKNIDRLTQLSKHFTSFKVYYPMREMDNKEYKVYIYFINYQYNRNNLDTRNLFIKINNIFLNTKRDFIFKVIRNMADKYIVDTTSFDFMKVEGLISLYT